jgi:hypothetical protein
MRSIEIVSKFYMASLEIILKLYISLEIVSKLYMASIEIALPRGQNLS